MTEKEKIKMLRECLEEIRDDGFYPHSQSEFMKPGMYKAWAADCLAATADSADTQLTKTDQNVSKGNLTHKEDR